MRWLWRKIVSVLTEWLGDGGQVVDNRVAQHRSVICAQCPENRHGKWWETAKHGVAEVIRTHLEVKNGMNLTLPNEAELNMCHVCGCCIPLKVWVPISYIRECTDAETLAKFPKHCWISAETP